jgi:hypothetical protein
MAEIDRIGWGATWGKEEFSAGRESENYNKIDYVEIYSNQD